MKNTYCIAFVLLLGAFIVNLQSAHAQTVSSDFEAWSGIEVDYSISDVWKVGLEEQIRWKEDASVIDQYFTQLVTEFELADKFELGGGIRYIRENDTKGAIQGYENHVRYHVDLGYKYKLQKFSIKHRIRYQNKNEIDASKQAFANPHLRFKTGMEYRIKGWKLDPKISGELFYQLGDTRENEMDKYRLALGTSYKIKKFGKISLNYLMEKELNTSNPLKVNIIELKLNFSINP